MSETATRRVERTRREAIKRGLALMGLAGAATTGKFVVDGSPAGASVTLVATLIDETTSPRSMDLVNGKWLNVEPGSLKEKIGVPDMY